MLTHRPTVMRAGTAAIIFTAIALLTLMAYQGAAAQGGEPPQAPSNVMAHLIAGPDQEPQVRISWDAPDEGKVTSHTVNRDDGQPFQVTGGATTYSDREIEPGMSYSYTVTAQSDAGSSPASDPVAASIPAAPAAPGGLTATAADPVLADTSASVTITWNPATAPQAEACEQAFPVIGYVVERLHGDGSDVLADLEPGASSFTDDGPDFGAEYTYRVYATSDIGNGPPAMTALTTPLRPVGTPTGLSATITDPFDGNVSLSWTAPTEGPAIASYLANRYLGDDPYTATEDPVLVRLGIAGTTATDATAEAGVLYSYQVIAVSADLNVSDPSNTAVMEAPAPPTGLTATSVEGTVSLSWNAPDAGTVGTHRVERQEQGGDWAHLAEVTGTSHDDDTAEDGSTYTYRVQHRNSYGGSAWSTSGPVTMVTAPGAPTGVSATADGDDNVITWTAPAVPFISGYHVRHRSGDGEWSNLSESVGAADVSYTHEGSAADVNHHYAVRAHNAAGNGPWSETATTIRVTPPTAPTGVSASLDGDDIVLTWTRPDSVHIDGYTVRYRAGPDAEFTESKRLPATATSHTIEDITGDTVYRLQARAHNASGDGPWSEAVELEKVLLPSAPTSVSVDADDTNITLSWGAPETGRIAGYHVSYGEASSEANGSSVDRSAEQTSFVHTDSVEGTAYAYQVRAHNSAGNGPWSEPVEATRLLAPGAPTEPEGRRQRWRQRHQRQLAGAGAGSIVATYEIEYGLSSEQRTGHRVGERRTTSYFTHTRQ